MRIELLKSDASLFPIQPKRPQNCVKAHRASSRVSAHWIVSQAHCEGTTPLLHHLLLSAQIHFTHTLHMPILLMKIVADFLWKSMVLKWLTLQVCYLKKCVNCSYRAQSINDFSSAKSLGKKWETHQVVIRFSAPPFILMRFIQVLSTQWTIPTVVSNIYQ